MKYEFLQPKFTEGVLARSLQGRSSEEFYHYGYKSSKNMIPILSGPVIKRPGTNYIGDAKHSTAIFIPFFKDKDNTYIIELGSTSPSSGGYLRVWSQDQLLTDNTAVSDPPTYEYTAVFPWTAAELSTLKTTQSGDVIFVCCPTKPPQKIFRTLSDAETSAVADDNSVWAIEEFVTVDGPYTEINIWDESDDTKRYTLKLTTEPTATKEIGAVEFNTIDNTLVLANHGLQVGQKIKLNGSSGTGWGNVRQNISGTTSTDGKAQSKMDGSNSVAIASTACTITHSNASIAGTNTLKPNNIVTFTGTFASVSGFATSTNYYVSSTGLTTSTFQLKASVDGAVITPGGSGTATPSFVGALGDDTFDLDVYVIATTSTTIQFSDTDGGKIREFELVQTDTDNPETTASNAEVKLEKYVYEASATPRSLTLYNNNGSGSQTSTNSYFSSNDIGRLIRINPLLKGGNNIGGIKWAWGIIKSQGTDSTNGIITVEFKSEMANTRGSYGTAEFRLGAFSDGEGYPHVAQIYQQRMVMAATNVQPSTIWLSETANFYSFSPSVISEQGSPDSVTEGVSSEIIIDSSALTFTLDSDTLDEIKWLGESKKLSMGTSAGIYMLYGSETNLSVTPFRFTINRETTFSATDTAPVIVSNALLYTQIGGKDVQALELEGDTVSQWISSKISLKGYDIIKDSMIEKMVWQERPFAIIWFMMANGKLLSLSYDRSLEFKAWSEHVIAGKIYRKVTATIQKTADAEAVVSDSSGDEVADSGNKILFTDTAHGLINTNIVQLTTTGTLPTGLSLSTNYYVVNKTDNTFKLALTSGGADILWTDDGAGTHSWHKPTMYTVAGDQTSMFVVDKYATVSNYADSNWNVSQEIITVKGVGFPIATVGTFVDGGTHTNNTYTSVSLGGGSGSGAVATVVVAGNDVTTVTITTAGINYEIGDVLTIDNATIGGAADATCTVATVTESGATNTEITTRLDSSGFASTTATNPIIEADGSSHAQVTDIDMIPTASHDQIWFKIKRTINGSDIYHVETLSRFPTEGALDRNAYVFSDSAITGTVPASKIISGLKHLRNEKVQVYYEGMQHANMTVSNTGASDETITLSHTQGNEHVTGLPYDAELETLTPSAPENQFSYTKRLIKAAVLVEESLGIQLEYNDLSEELLFRTTQDAMGRQIPLFSGLRKLSLSGIGWDTHNLKIVSNGPFPMQLNAIIIEADTGGS